jgi:hypothetical protein
MATPRPFADCLRPTFTEKVQNWLLKGQLINIYGTEAQGIHRLVDGLKQHEPEYALFLRFNMKGYADSYQDFLTAVADGLGLPTATSTDLRSLINNYLGSMPDKLWLCLEHFDRLADRQVDGKDVDRAGYDIHFLNYLNSLKNNPQVSLIICSNRMVGSQELHIGGRAVTGSRLDFTEKPALPALTIKELENYLLLRLPAGETREAFAAQKPSYYNLLIKKLHEHPATVPFLEFLADQQLEPDWGTERFLVAWRQWEQEYNRNHSPSLDRRLGTWEKIAKTISGRLGRMLGIGKLWQASSKQAKLLIGLITSAAVALWQWWEELLLWLN